jgi:shikimate kinase
MDNIALIGLMGCGKTSLGKALAKRTGKRFVDLDGVVRRKAGMEISDIFECCGEDAFRKLETEAVKEIAARKNQIISTGGGVVLRDENRLALKKSAFILFIDRPVERILEDVDARGRPLLKEGKERLYALYDARIGLYRAWADAIVANDSAFEDCLKNMLLALDTLREEKK